MIVWWETDRRERGVILQDCDCPGICSTVQRSGRSCTAATANIPTLETRPRMYQHRWVEWAITPPSLSCQPGSAAALGSGEGSGRPDAGWISNALQINKFPPLVSRVLVLHGPELSTSTISSQQRSKYFQPSICHQLLSWLLWEQFFHWFPVWLIKYRVR